MKRIITALLFAIMLFPLFAQEAKKEKPQKLYAE